MSLFRDGVQSFGDVLEQRLRRTKSAHGMFGKLVSLLFCGVFSLSVCVVTLTLCSGLTIVRSHTEPSVTVVASVVCRLSVVCLSRVRSRKLSECASLLFRSVSDAACK